MTEHFVIALQCCINVVCAVALVENALTLAVLVGTKNLRIKYYAFLFNLALADFVFAPSAISATWTSSPVISGLTNASFTVSILTVLAAAVNRYLALYLVPPARYDAKVTGCRLVGVCILLWCLGVGYSVLASDTVIKAILNRAQVLAFAMVVFAAWVITALVYLLAFRKIKQYTPPLASAAGISANEERDQIRIRQTRRLLVMFALILVVAFVSWVPICAQKVKRFFDRSFGKSGSSLVFVWGCRLLYTLSPAINPLIYWWRLEEFRQGFYAMFCRCVFQTKPSVAGVDPTAQNDTVTEADL